MMELKACHIFISYLLLAHKRDNFNLPEPNNKYNEMNINLLVTPTHEDSLHSFANFVLRHPENHDAVSCGLHWRKKTLKKALVDNELPSPLSVDGNHGDSHLRSFKAADAFCQTDAIDTNAEIKRLLLEREFMLKQIEVLTLGQKVEKRNSNACREHKLKHLKCPVTCPNRKSGRTKDKPLLKRKKSQQKASKSIESDDMLLSEMSAEDMPLIMFAERSLRPRKKRSTNSESEIDLDELYHTAQEELID